jgi:uracil-DNA glycosylase family 4
MPYTGEGRRKILIIGEAPGETEDAENTQLVGRAGQHLRGYLTARGVDLDWDCWKTNALICRPPDNREPTDEEIGHCLPNLTRCIRETQPEVIIPMGGAAVTALLGHIWREEVGPVGRWVGWRIPAQAYNAWVCPTWHPSYLLRAKDPLADLWFGRHLDAALACPGRPWPGGPPDYRKQIQIIPDPAMAAEIIHGMCERGGRFAFDYETNMLKPDGPDARIVSCSICWEGRRTIAYPWHGPAIAATQKFLRTPHKKIASNLKFEERWTRRVFGHGVRGWWWDTMLAAHTYDPRKGITSIKFQSLIYFGVPVWNAHIEPFLKTKGTREANQVLREIDLNDLLLYNGLDSLLEYMVAMRQMEEGGISNETP